MADQVAKIVEQSAAPHRQVERAIVMHGTSPYRETAARMLVELLDATGGDGVAFGWTDVLAPTLLSPVHVVTRRGLSWEIDVPLSHSETVAADGSFEWKLVVKGATQDRIDRVQPLLRYTKGYFAHTRSRDVPTVSSDTPFVELLQAFRLCGFRLADTTTSPIKFAFREEIAGLPEDARGSADQVTRWLRDPGRLQGALLRFGSELDVAGAFTDAAAVHLVGYELALQRGDGVAGIDAARSAGRAFRRMGELGSSIRWYELAARIAEVEGDRGRLALALDGAGNTHRHRGSFPRAREAYEKAWGYAIASGERTAIGNVATSMMTVEREAGDLASAATYGWTSLVNRTDPEARARALINLGTLLREGRDLENARRAFRIAHRATRDPGYRALAADALAYCAALLGDPAAYARHYAEVRQARVEEPFLRAQIAYFRALSLAALGQSENARRILRAVERYARRWELAEWEVKAAETEVKAAETELPLPQIPPMETPAEVRQGLRKLEVAAV